MSALNRPDNFAGRVSYAAAVISAGRPTSRGFDNCFENGDGDAVAAAMVRRARRNPKLAANLWRYLNRETAEAAAAALDGKGLAAEAARMRAEAEARFAAFMAEREAKRAQPQERPLAAPGLTSYRYREPFGFVMIGARDDAEALREAARSIEGAADPSRLEIWDAAAGAYRCTAGEV